MKVKPKVAEVDLDDLMWKIDEIITDYAEVKTEYVDTHSYSRSYSSIDMAPAWGPLKELLTESLTGPIEKE